MASPYLPPSLSVALPPQKRQKLSPNPLSPSPYGNPPSATSPSLSLPGTPGAQQPQFHQQLQQAAYNTSPYQQPPSPVENGMRPTPGPGAMGPPQRPADKPEKPMDINDLNDLVTASGIDIREEENYLAQTYRNQHHHSHQQQQPQAGANQPYLNGSFTSLSTSPSGPSPNSSFQGWTSQQSSFGPFQQGPGGPLHESAVPQRTVEDELQTRHKAAARRVAESRQHHSNDPFVSPGSLRQFLHNRTYSYGVKMLPDPPLDPRPMAPVPNAPNGARADVRVGNVDGRPVGIADARANPAVSETVQSEILALVSLATQERLRTLVEDAFTLSRGRQASSHGVVPPEWADIATGKGTEEPTTAVPQSISGTSWDNPAQDEREKSGEVMSPSTVPQKRPAPDSTEVNLPTPPTDTAPTSPLPTHAYPPLLPRRLKTLVSSERKAEEARLAARAKRRKTSTTPASATSPNSATSPAASTPADKETPDKPLAAGGTAPKLTKKERERMARGAQSEEMQHKNANATASMALGGWGQKYSWLSAAKGGLGGGGGGPSRSGTATPARLSTGGTPTSGPAAGVGGAQGNRDSALWALNRRWGEWREDDPKKGRGIQGRDWARAVEVDGRAKKSLVRAWCRMR